MSNIFRSLVFVPGNNPRFLEKAKSLPADIVCFDLEDSVPDKEKKKARVLIKNTLKQRSKYSPDVFVRTNSPESGMIEADLKEIVQKGIDGIVIPKVNSAKELKKIEKIISSLEKKRKIKGIRLMPSIESALGVVNCYEISSSSKRIDALVFGIFDLLNDMGIEYTKGNPPGAKYSRYNVPVAATAAGVVAIDGIWQDLKDKNGFTKDCQVGKSWVMLEKVLFIQLKSKLFIKFFILVGLKLYGPKKFVAFMKNQQRKGRVLLLLMER